MRYVPDFYNFARLLELDDDLRPRGVIARADLGREADFGFFVDRGEEIDYVAPGPDGPVLAAGRRRCVVTEGATLRLVEEGGGRFLDVEFGRERFRIVAPRSDLIDPNFDDDEPDMTDFYVWLERRLAMPHVRAKLTG